VSFPVGISSRGIFSVVFLSAFVFLLTGCTLATTAPDAPLAGTALQGKVYGGNQPVVGAHVYLMAATVSGVGSAGYGLASTSLLSAATTGHSDSVGAYVLTDSTGSFRLDAGQGSSTYDYTCPSATTQVYLYVLGGNPGAGTNNAAGMMTALGSCGSLNSSQFITVNELTTVAAAYALAGFATDALHISIPQYASTTQQTNSITDALARTGLQNAFATAANLVSNATGAALSTTPGGNGTPVTAQVITLGNILASCVNSNGAVTGPSSPTNCYTLFNNAGSTGGATGTIPSDAATAAINISHYPYVSSTVMSNLFGLQAASGAPFTGGDSSQPTDFTIAIKYTGGGLNGPNDIAIDSSGNVWTGNISTNSLSEFSPTGAAVSSASGYTGGGISGPISIAVDAAGNVWIANNGNNSISNFSFAGAAISGASGYTGGGLNSPTSIAIDALGNAWTCNGLSSSNSLSKFSSSGTAISGSSGYIGGGLSAPISIAVDASGNVWTTNSSNSLSKFSSSGTPISPNAPNFGPYTGGGLDIPYGIAIDGSSNVWAANHAGNSISVFSSSGTPLSNGFLGGGLNTPFGIAIDGSGNVWVASRNNSSIGNFTSSGTPLSPSSGYTGGSIIYSPVHIAIDGSGNVWVTNYANLSIMELVGAATPVVTPIVANLIAPYTAPASKP
jgi:sugar lactone lactonase YvrE